MNLIRPDWPAPANILAFSTTRTTADEDLAQHLAGISRPLIKQVHGTAVVDAQGAKNGVEADAIIARQAGVACSVVTADCLPILLCDGSANEVAAVHAGWRGLAAGIVEQTLSQMASSADELMAWIGPAISQACYEVGGEVREAFLAAAHDTGAETDACFEPRGEKFMADLPGLARVRLAAQGLRDIYGGDLCTWSDAARFHSYRRDGAAAGRITSLICRQA